MPDLR